MKIHINENSDSEETEITICCKRINPDVEKIIAMLRVMDLKLTGIKDNQTFILDASNVLGGGKVWKKLYQ